MPGIFAVDSRFYVPLEGAMQILEQVMNATCSGCPISVGGEPPDPVVKLTYCSSDFEITEALQFFELGAQDVDAIELNQETPPPYCDGHLEGPVIDPESLLPTIIVDQHVITTTVGAVAFGAVIYTGDDVTGKILGVAKFPVPIGTGEIGDVFKLSGKWSLCACVPEVDT